MTRKLYRFYWDVGRMGHLEGVFVADERQVDAAVGRELYFGEVLGKHSEVYGPLGRKDLTVVSEDPALVEALAILPDRRGRPGGTLCGYNPLDYLREDA